MREWTNSLMGSIGRLSEPQCSKSTAAPLARRFYATPGSVPTLIYELSIYKRRLSRPAGFAPLYRHELGTNFPPDANIDEVDKEVRFCGKNKQRYRSTAARFTLNRSQARLSNTCKRNWCSWRMQSYKHRYTSAQHRHTRPRYRLVGQAPKRTWRRLPT